MEKRGLGRGLAALISDSAPTKTGGEVISIPLTQLTANPYQPRTQFDIEKMEELTASIREHGILQPILVIKIGHEQYELVAGERRFRAAQTAGLSIIPALVKEFSKQEQLEVAIIENLQREDIGVMETARAYRNLIDEFGLQQDAIAQRVGKSRSAISNTLRLLKLPQEIQESVELGEISEGHARALLTATEKETMLAVWKSITQKSLTVRDVERLCRVSHETPKEKTVEPNHQPESVAAQRADPNEVAFAVQLQEKLGTKVSIRRMTASSGKIEIEFYSTDELERIGEILLA